MTESTNPRESHAITVSDHQLWLIRSALQEYLAMLSHTEGNLVDEVKTLLEALPKTSDPGANVNRIFPDQSSRLTL